MKVLDLFSGIGGFSLGLEAAGMETIAFCEIEHYPRKVLAKHWPDIPIAGDVTKLTYSEGVLYDDGQEIYRGTIDVVCGGFPCQDISVAGNQKGIEEGTRSGLWSECARLLGEVRPSYAIFENVTALLSGQRGRWFQRVLFDISEVGYDAEWHCIPASELGAHHHRDRVWIIAYPNNVRGWQKQELRAECKDKAELGNDGKEKYVAYPTQLQCDGSNDNTRERMESEAISKPRDNGGQANVADSDSKRQQGQGKPIKQLRKEAKGDRKASIFESICIRGEWEAEPELGRVADGIPNRSHRLKGLGNAVVPQIPELIGRVILESSI